MNPIVIGIISFVALGILIILVVVKIIKVVNKRKIKINLSKIDNIVFEDIDHSDWPDMCDAFIASADIDGRPMTEDELDELNENKLFVHQKLMDYLF